jgi:hypothetical protein
MRVPVIVPRIVETMSQAEIADIIAPRAATAEIIRAVGERFDRAVMETAQQSSRAMDPDGLEGFDIDHIVGVGETLQHVARQMGTSAAALGRAFNQMGQAAARAPIRPTGAPIQMLPVPEGVPTYREVQEAMRRRMIDAMGVDAAMMAPTPRTPPAKPKPVQPGAPTTGKRKLNLGDD